MPEPKRKARRKELNAVGADPLDALDGDRLAGLLGQPAERPNGASPPPEGPRAMRRTRTRRDAAAKKAAELQLEIETPPAPKTRSTRSSRVPTAESAPAIERPTPRTKRYDPKVAKRTAARGPDAGTLPVEQRSAASGEPQVAPPAESQVAPPAEEQAPQVEPSTEPEVAPSAPVERAWQPPWEADVEPLSFLGPDPDDPDSVVAAARSLVAKGRSAQAVALLGRALAGRARSSAVAVELGRIHSSAGAFADAEEALHLAVRLDPESADAHLEMGILQSKKGLYANAVRELEEALVLECDLARGSYYLGICFNQLDRIEDAEKAFHEAIAADPQFDRAWYQLGIVWDRKGDVDRAREMYQRARQVAARARG